MENLQYYDFNGPVSQFSNIIRLRSFNSGVEAAVKIKKKTSANIKFKRRASVSEIREKIEFPN
jgi:hypothetical protein